MIKEEEVGKNKSELQYQDINDKTNRSDIKLINNDRKVESKRLSLAGEEMKVNVKNSDYVKNEKNEKNTKFDIPQVINTGNPCYLDIKPYILQSPQLQLFGIVNNLAVCPFCKYTGTMEICYQRSPYQKKCCFALAVVGLFICCWIPLIIRALSDQVYKCTNCSRILKTIPHNQI